MNTLQLHRTASLAALALSLCSCASVSVKNVGAKSARGAQKPRTIAVQPFEIKGAVINENFARKNKGQLGTEAQGLVASYLVKDLQAMGLQAKLGGRGDWILGGRFTRVAEGSRILRMGIGLGVGGTKMETEVQVRSAASKKPILTFGTTGGSNASPGAATNPIPFSSAPTALLASKEGVTDDSARTSRMIAATLGDYMVKRGWLRSEQVLHKPKMQK